MLKNYFHLFLSICLCGCVSLSLSGKERFLDKHYVLLEKDENKLDGPYTMKELISPNTILIENDNKDIIITLRGCLITGDKKIDEQAKIDLGVFARWGASGVYLLKNSVVWNTPTKGKAVAYTPANRVYTGREKYYGKMTYRNLSYTMPQLLSLINGEYILDHSDTQYTLYNTFAEAEALAKKYRKGYWKTHKE